MATLAYLVLIAFITVGYLAIFFTTFGTLIMLAGIVLFALFTGFEVVGLKALAILSLLYLIGEAVEYLSIIVGAKSFGASNLAVVGALVGGIVGGIAGSVVPVLGLVLGVFLGIFLGAFIMEYAIKADLKKSLKAGTGSVIGRFVSIAVKAVIGAVMIAIVLINIINRMRS